MFGIATASMDHAASPLLFVIATALATRLLNEVESGSWPKMTDRQPESCKTRCSLDPKQYKYSYTVNKQPYRKLDQY